MKGLAAFTGAAGLLAWNAGLVWDIVGEGDHPNVARFVAFSLPVSGIVLAAAVLTGCRLRGWLTGGERVAWPRPLIGAMVGWAGAWITMWLAPSTVVLPLLSLLPGAGVWTATAQPRDRRALGLGLHSRE